MTGVDRGAEMTGVDRGADVSAGYKAEVTMGTPVGRSPNGIAPLRRECATDRVTSVALMWSARTGA